MFLIRTLRVVPNPPELYSHPMNDVNVVINLVSCIVNNDAIPPIIALLLILEDEVDDSSRTASAGKVNKPEMPKNRMPRFNRLYVFDAYNLFVLFDIELDNILHTPDDRNRYPNDPAVNFGIKFCIFGCIVEDSTLDDDVDIEEMVPILTSSNRPDSTLVMVASLYPDDRYFGGDGNATSTSLLFASSVSVSSVLLVLSVSSIVRSESGVSSLLSAANKGNEELSRGILHPY